MGITKEQLLSTVNSMKTYIDEKSETVNCLMKDNTEAFVPTEDYHPTTKKYVDDLFNRTLEMLEIKVDTINRT